MLTTTYALYYFEKVRYILIRIIRFIQGLKFLQCDGIVLCGHIKKFPVLLAVCNSFINQKQ